MRIVAQVFLFYGLVLVLGALWRLLPLGSAMPDVVALAAVYLGLTARHRVAPSTLGAVLIGYLGDLLMGTPRGAQALVAGLVCILAHVVHRRLIVRGRLVAAVFAFFTGLAAGLLTLALRAFFDLTPAGITGELSSLLVTALLTGAVGPLVFKLCRRIDAQFARTLRERDAALEGLVP